MTERPESNNVSLDEHLALKNLINSISDEELETAKKYLEALHQVDNNSDTNYKG